MARVILIKRIIRPTGKKGIPRPTRLEQRIPLSLDDNMRAVANKILQEVVNKTGRDKNDRQIEYGTSRRTPLGGHKIVLKVLYRVYHSKSDGQVHVYQGEAHQGQRDN